MAAFDIFKLTFLVNLLSTSNLWSVNDLKGSNNVGMFPLACNNIDQCPSYDVIHTGDRFEIRRYNSSTWISTKPIEAISFADASRTGFRKLFNYIQGKNDFQQIIKMTGTILTEVKPSNGPFSASSFVVSFYVPKVNQATSPLARGVHLQERGVKYVAVRQFSGFVKDVELGQEADALYASVAGTNWADSISNPTEEYMVVQYNSPFQYRNRVNEIWFSLEDDCCFFYTATNKKKDDCCI